MALEDGQLMTIGTVAAANIANALELPPEHVPKIEQAIRDEIDAMSSHFTLAFADIQEQYNHSLDEIKSGFTFAEENPWSIFWATAAVFSLGALLGHYVI